jgi:hypothetical protein
MTAKEFQEYADMLAIGEALPDDVDLASRNPEGGDTLAHVAGMYNMLPHGFDQWDLRAIPHGETVAHIAAVHGFLPPDFGQWHLADKAGMTVAHEAARHGRLPLDFDRLDLAANTGWTVAHECARYGYLPNNFDQWDLREKKQGVTVAHIFAMCGESFPQGFDQWGLTSNSGWSVAHIAARRGNLPADFDQWDLVSPDGETVRDIAEEYERNHKNSPKMGM